MSSPGGCGVQNESQLHVGHSEGKSFYHEEHEAHEGQMMLAFVILTINIFARCASFLASLLSDSNSSFNPEPPGEDFGRECVAGPSERSKRHDLSFAGRSTEMIEVRYVASDRRDAVGAVRSAQCGRR